ncbi:MAG: cytochrome c oxidase assembly protein, partial [Pseudomonadota bacterium]|nr:cytochrome c oxidase assembly protein [Pseudomonadota bacterium]
APALYEAAIGNDGVHIVQHLTLLASALLFWWSIVHCGRGGRSGYGGGALGLFLTALHAKFLGILILLAPSPLYDVYGTALPWNLTPLEDQQVAGMIMLLPMDAVFLAGTLVLLGLWLKNAVHGRAHRTQE